MAGTDDDAVATGDDDALYVLTAVLLTPAQFPSVLGDDYPAACAALDLAPLADGYGLVLGQDGDGRAVDGRHRRRLAGRRRHRVLGLRHGARSVAGRAHGRLRAARLAARRRRRGPGSARPARPARPSSRSGRRCARRTPTVVGPGSTAPRRRRDRTPVGDVAGADRRQGVRRSDGDTSAEQDAQGDESGKGEEADAERERTLSGVRASSRRLAPTWTRHLRSGRVRSSFASGDARTLRADGPGWSMVARTDDIAFVLLDEKPGEVLPVGRGPELPGLLEALDKMAVRPS